MLIGTGDRWHAPASILAAKAGKDVYSEKPCGLTIGLCQALDDTIRQTKRVFQAGTQRRSVANFQAAVRLAQSGKLGKIHTLFASVYTPSIETTWLPGEPTPPRDVCRLGPVARAGPVAALQPARTSPAAGAGTGTSTPAPGCSTGEPTRWTCASGPTGPTTPCPSSTSRPATRSPPAMPTA